MEHLRTVHFALVTVCVGIILLLSSAKYDAKRAASQMNDVVRISASWPNEISEQYRETTWSSERSVGFRPWFQAEYGPSHQALTFHVEEPNLFVCEAHSSPTGYSNMADITPSTLDDFVFAWDLLSMGPVPVDAILNVALVGTIEKPNSDIKKAIKITTDLPFKRGTNPVLLHLVDVSPCDFNSTQGPSLVGDTSERWRITFKVTTVKRAILSQHKDTHGRLAIRRVDNTPGFEGHFFEESFPDLSEAMTGRSSEDIDTLSHQILEEASKGVESFEILGVKFPANQVTQWGIILLVSIQLYLVTYLRRLSGRLTPEDPGWEVPWIAMDNSLLARVMLDVSFLILPISAVFLVTLQVWSQLSEVVWRGTWRTIEYLIIYDRKHLWAMLLCCCGSVCLSILSWKYRPKLSESVVPPQLFE